MHTEQAKSQPLQDCTRGKVNPSDGTDILCRTFPTRPFLTDEEREEHIRDCTRLMEEAYERYERDGFIADRGDASRWMMLRDEAVKGRSARQVARMERERGLLRA